MSEVSQLPDQEAVYDEASLWIARMDRKLSVGEENDLRIWLKLSEENQQVFFGMAEQWDKMDELSCLSDIFPSAAQRSSRSMKVSGSAISASIVCVALLAVFLFDQRMETPVSGDSTAQVSDYGLAGYETAIGEHSSVVLPDGSSIFLNTNTAVSVAYTATERLIRLQRGELHVEVAHNPDRPLRVITHDHVVEAVGTAFNMELTGNHGVELLVTDGRVLVAQRENSSALSDSLGSRVELSLVAVPSIAVSAGEEILLGSEEETLTLIDPEEIAVKLSWRDGNLIFKGESLQIAMAEVGRYTSTEFIFLDDTTRAVRIAGRFKAGDLDTLLATLRDSFNISYRQVGDARIELSSR